jgi:GT2 family glycosyltransferase
MMPKVYVLIPAHNNKKEVLELLDCLNKQTYKDTEVILVDDGSSDNTEGEVRKSFPDTVILKGDGNLWWTGANVTGINEIMKEAKDGDFILLINNDLTVDTDYVATLVNTSIQYSRAITGSALIDYHNSSFIESGIKLTPNLELLVNRDSELINSTEIDSDVDALPGRGTLVPVEVFKAIGNLNLRKLPHYGADYEFFIRAKRAGFRLIVSNRARVLAKLNISGINTPDKKILSMRECFPLLISKKSRTNIYYYLNYVWLCSEKEDRMRNLVYSAWGILTRTVAKTFPLIVVTYPVLFLLRIVKKLFLFIYRFALKKYPLRYSDIRNHGLSPADLLHSGILTEEKFREIDLYFINHDAAIDRLPTDKQSSLSRLTSLSFSYRHKLAIIREKIKLLILK